MKRFSPSDDSWLPLGFSDFSFLWIDCDKLIISPVTEDATDELLTYPSSANGFLFDAFFMCGVRSGENLHRLTDELNIFSKC